MRPVSIGSRKASSALRGNSGELVEEEHSMMRQRDLTPAAAVTPPPTSAAGVAVWCGARITRRPHCAGV